MIETLKKALEDFGKAQGFLIKSIQSVEADFSSIERKKTDLENQIKIATEELSKLNKQFSDKKTEFDKYFKEERDSIENEKSKTRSLQVEAEENYKKSKLSFDESEHKRNQWEQKLNEVEKLKVEHSDKISKINKFMLDVK